VFVDSNPRTLTYSATPPAGVAAVGAFTGQLSIDGQLKEIASAGPVTIAPPTPIQIVTCRREATGMRLHVRGPSDQTAVLEATSDFRTWTELKSIFIPNGDVEVSDESAPAHGLRFYRLRVH
jgi:hypothetical protein